MLSSQHASKRISNSTAIAWLAAAEAYGGKTLHKQGYTEARGQGAFSSTFRILGGVAEGVRKPLQKADRDLDGLRAGP